MANQARVAAGTMIFNGWDIAPSVVAHLAREGITDFYLVDHRSADDPRDEFLRRVPDTVTIHWARKNSALFSQPATMTALATLARQDGFEAFVAFDVDEFFTGTNRSLADEVRDWLDSDDTRSLRCPMVNFFQSEDVLDFAPASLASVHYRAAEGELPDEAFTDANPEFRRFPFSRPRMKAILRLVAGVDGDSDWLKFGNHAVLNIVTGEKYPATRATGIEVLHLPLRSRNGSIARRGNAFRKPTSGGTTLETGGGEFSMSDADLDTEWTRASSPAGATAETLVIGGFTAIRDDRLADRSDAIATLLRDGKGKPAAFVDETARLADAAQDLAMLAFNVATGRGRMGEDDDESVGQGESRRFQRRLESRRRRLGG